MDFFKPHIEGALPYKGGATRDRIVGTGGTVYKMSSNENMLGPSPKAIKAIQDNLGQLNEYRYENDRLFRAVLEGFFKDSITAEQFLIANSGMELLDLICRGFLQPGTECILSTPTFLAYQSFARVEGAKVVDIPLRGDSFGLDVEGILAAVNDRTRILFLGNPNNPTGCYFPRADTDKLIQALPPNVVVIYDEVYYQYVDKPDYARAAEYIWEGRLVIGIHSFSKAYGLAGIRLGYCFSTPEIAEYLYKLRRPFMVNTLSMEAGMAALSDTPHIARTVDQVQTEKEWLYTQLRGLGVEFWESNANFLLCRSPYTNSLFIQDMLEQGIMIRGAEVFGALGCFRVTVGTGEANRAFIRALERILNTRQG